MKTIIIASHNVHKLREIGQLLPEWEVRGEDSGAEETADDFAGNARIKARAIAPLHPEVAALDGAPGVRSARYAGEDGDTPANNALLLKNLAGVTDRRARFTCVVVLIAPDGTEHVLEGHCPGRIAEAPSGTGGFGYDPLFVPDGYDCSFAELSAEEKNAISHRGRALAAVRELLG